MENKYNIKLAQTDKEIEQIAKCAEITWHDAYDNLLPDGQVDYMIEKYQSFYVLKNDIKNNGYVYYIIQEAICNSIKHSRGSRICVKIQSTLEELVVIVKDDGIGLNNNNIRKEGHCGILSMNERATSINGVLSIDGKRNGATVCLIVPWEDIKDDE